MRLSSTVDQIKAHYAVVVVGSGYGGGIAASRLARAGQQVCLLERGKEFEAGQFPDTLAEAAEQMQADTPEAHVGSPLGLFDFRMNDDINVFQGCGLGGTSLINANVSIRPEPRIFEDARWPAALRQEPVLLEDGFRHAEEMLKPVRYPDTGLPLAKLEAHRRSALAMNARFEVLPINVTFKEPPNGINHVGVEQHACTLCGDCVTGCNHRAKNTTAMNYLPDAWNHGAEIFTQVSVRRVAANPAPSPTSPGRWLIYFRPVGVGIERFGNDDLVVRADVVVLAAGALGSTEILLRSREHGLPLSDRVGRGFTGNGDVLAFAYNNDQAIGGVGAGTRPPEQLDTPRPGPCITGVIDLRDAQSPLEDNVIIEEGSLPGALAPLLPQVLAAAAADTGIDTDSGVRDYLAERTREVESLTLGSHRGAVANTQTYLVMANDDASGLMALEGDRLRIRWPGVGEQPLFGKIHGRLEQATKGLGGTFVKNPIWFELSKHPLVTVHPLGGCGMGEDAGRGVVNHKHQVFSGKTGTAVHDGLYVSDGSVVPRALGVNPLLTISALGERCCALLARDRKWTIDYELPSRPKAPPPPALLGIEFSEKMAGHMSKTLINPGEIHGIPRAEYLASEADGKEKKNDFAFVLTIVGHDLDKFVTDENYQATASGWVEAPFLSPEPMTVTDGRFTVFITDPDRPDTKQMRYSFKMAAIDGKTYRLEGYKVIHHDAPLDVLADTTTLFTTVWEVTATKELKVAQGVLHVHPDDFARQMTTIKAVNATSPKQSLEAAAKFGKYFGGVLYEIYGGVFAGQTFLDPGAPPRKRRPLRAPTPELHPFLARDGVPLRLTRYRGGNKGPVMLSHGLGVSSRIFSTDTIETNLVEYLCAHGYDTWLLDYRASIELPAASLPATGDDVATKDYPAAVEKVLAVSGAKDLEVVAHCWGATTFTMAMLAGLTGVRKAVISQVSTHCLVPTATKLKTGLHVADFLDAVGVDNLTAYADKNEKWYEKLFDVALALYPTQLEERCSSPVCHRITFLYAPLYEHDRLNQATHAGLHELFGLANVKSFEHLGKIVNKGHVVAADGADVYLPQLKRMAIPLTFIHGAENGCFFPASTVKTIEGLRAANPGVPYTRHEIAGYGHIDCIFGRDAARDVFPYIVDGLG
ncbi:MAG TPA: alpha/beta fold hydrolase [Polyangia bacterium]|nr:alpha/beta fold hydrolase [Polyangia bacterium]